MHKKIIIIVFVSLFSLLGVFSFIVYSSNISEIEKQTMAFWEKGDERRGGLVITNSIKENRPKKFVLTKFDVQKPVATVVVLNQTLSDGKQDILMETFYLERTGFNTFRVNESILNSSMEYKFEDAIKLVQKYDVYKNNPDKDKIINYPKLNLTTEQIKLNQEKLEQVKIDAKNEKESVQSCPLPILSFENQNKYNSNELSEGDRKEYLTQMVKYLDLLLSKYKSGELKEDEKVYFCNNSLEQYEIKNALTEYQTELSKIS